MSLEMDGTSILTCHLRGPLLFSSSIIFDVLSDLKSRPSEKFLLDFCTSKALKKADFPKCESPLENFHMFSNLIILIS